MEKFTTSKIFRNEDKTLDGAKFLLLFNFSKRTFIYQIVGKGISNIIIGDTQTFNLCFKGTFHFDDNNIYLNIKEKRDLFYNKKFLPYKMNFSIGYQLSTKNNQLILKLDKILSVLQWGDEPKYQGFFIEDVYQTYYSKV